MRVLLISPTFCGIGGVAQHVRGLDQYLKNSGHKVDVLSSANSLTLPIKGLKNPSFMISSSLKTRFMKEHDIVHAHNIPSAKAMKNARGKKILSIHGIFSEQIDILHGKTTGNFSKKYEINALSWADAVTVVTNQAKIHYSKLGFDVQQIPNAIHLEQIPTVGKKLFQKQIIFAGRLSKEKGITQLLDVAETLPQDVNLLILGSGPLQSMVIEAEKKFQNLKYLGYKSKQETLQLIKGSDLLLQLSSVEGVSSTLLESMACKTPILASNIAGNQELVTNDENGVLVDPNEPDLIVQNILDLLSNKQRCSKLVKNASDLVINYSWDKVGQSYHKLYQSLL